MKKLIIVLKTIIPIGAMLSFIIYMCTLESKSNNHTPTEEIALDSIPTTPKFFSQSPSEGLWDALIYYEIQHPEIVYAQAVLETGHFKSKGCNEHNNLFGLYNSKKKSYHKFSHWTESVVAYREWIQYRYRSPTNYYEFLESIHYAEDKTYTTKLKKIVSNGKVKQDASPSCHQ
jgi:uncharacterized FlgJ-related protein